MDRRLLETAALAMALAEVEYRAAQAALQMGEPGARRRYAVARRVLEAAELLGGELVAVPAGPARAESSVERPMLAG